MLHKAVFIRTKGKTFLMNRWLLVLLMAVAFAPGFVSAQDTAYKALRTVGAQRGERALNQVVTIVGESGRPQPVAWRVTLDDPGAVAGERELDIVSGRISSERTPARPPASGIRPIDLTKLNLDSDAAFRAAEQEARRNQVGFDSMNYRLSVDAASGQTVWTLVMLDYEQRPVGTVRIAASNGTMLSAGNWVSEGQVVHGPTTRQRSDAEVLAGPPPPVNGDLNPPVDHRQPEYQDQKPASSSDDYDVHAGETAVQQANRYGASVVQFGHTVVRKTTQAFQTVGGWFQEKFTGHNTIDPRRAQGGDNSQEESSADRSSQPGPSHDPYNQPVTPPPQ